MTNDIYQNETKAYVYIWRQKSTQKWYIGSRTAKNAHPDDGYITSSKIVKPLIKADPTDWERQLIYIGDPIIARNMEAEILQDFNAAKHPDCFNLHNGDGKFNVIGKSPWNKGKKNPYPDEVLERMSTSHQGKKLSTEHKLKLAEKKQGENHNMYGKHHRIDSKEKMAKAKVGMFCGEKSAVAKLTWNDVKQIREEYESLEKKRGFIVYKAEQLGVYKTTIHKVVNYVTWINPPPEYT